MGFTSRGVTFGFCGVTFWWRRAMQCRRVNPLITRVIAYLLSGMIHQAGSLSRDVGDVSVMALAPTLRTSDDSGHGTVV